MKAGTTYQLHDHVEMKKPHAMKKVTVVAAEENK